MRIPPHPEDLLSARLDHELDQETAQAVDRHLDDCASCREELAEIDHVRQALRGSPPVPAPPGLIGSLIAGRRRADRRGASLALVAAAVALVTSLAFVDPADVAAGGSDNGPRATEKTEQDGSRRDGPQAVRRSDDADQSDLSLVERAEEAVRNLVDFLG